jgi:hypothetical protein
LSIAISLLSAVYCHLIVVYCRIINVLCLSPSPHYSRCFSSSHYSRSTIAISLLSPIAISF